MSTTTVRPVICKNVSSVVIYKIIMPCTHNALTDILSVHSSVSPVPDPKSRTEERSKLKKGRKEAHNLGDLQPHPGQKFKVQEHRVNYLNCQPFKPPFSQVNLG